MHKFAFRFDEALANYMVKFYTKPGEQLGVTSLMRGVEDPTIQYLDVGTSDSTPYILVLVNSKRSKADVIDSLLDAISAASNSLIYKGEISPHVVTHELFQQCLTRNS